MKTGTDPWGVDRGYEDTSRRWHATSPETREAILAAMGASDPNAALPDADSVRVVWGGRRTRWPASGTLRLEDGTPVFVRDRLPPDLPWGYHAFRSAEDESLQRVIVAPRQCLLPEPAWGWSAQLYAARSCASWGIGDLADLRRIGQWAKSLGAEMLLVNPLAAASPVLPQEPSPYFPTSRRFLNPLYLRVEETPGAGDLAAELDRVAAAGRALCDRRLIDRDEVFRLKDRALRLIWSRFCGSGEFDEYCRQRGTELEQFAAWCALAAKHQSGDWRAWPAEHRRPDSPAVRRFVEEHAQEVRYHQWLQWLLDRQLAEAAKATRLVQDLPIGVDPGGADAWVWQDVLAAGCTVGAPPDLFNPAGQDWNLPPFVPHRLRAAGYEPFIQTIRAALRHAGGLRIDHVMGLFRLYWIPNGFGPKRGAYVRYPAEEFLAIVALESRRAGAFVVGEDLGTVEPAVRRELRKRRILSFRVLWFEKTRPVRYPKLAMAAATTHDLPTIAGLWTGHDLAEQQAIGVGDEKSMREVRKRFAGIVGASDEASTAEVVARAHEALGEAPTLVLTATLDDALAVEDRPNLPGTTARQRANWSLALPGGIEALETTELPRRIARALSRAQCGAAANAPKDTMTS